MHVEKESGETRISILVPNVFMWCGITLAHYHFLRQILIRAHMAEVFASPNLQARLAYSKTMGSFIDRRLKAWQITALSALSMCIAIFFKSNPWRKYRSAIWLATSRSYCMEPKLNTCWIRVSPDPFSACDKGAGHETNIKWDLDSTYMTLTSRQMVKDYVTLFIAHVCISTQLWGV